MWCHAQRSSRSFLHHDDERIKSVLDDEGSVERAGRNPGEIARDPDFDMDLTNLGSLYL